MSPPAGAPDRRSGTYAVVVGAIVIAVCIAVLGIVATIDAAVALPVLVVDVLLLVAMIVARVTVRSVVRRQWAITGCLLVACALSLGAVLLIIAQQRA